MPLEALCGPGKALRAEPPDAKEFAGLKRSGRARLSDAANVALSLEGRFDLAFLIWTVTQCMRCALRHCAGTATDPPTAVSCFRFCRIHSDLVPMCGVCWRNVMRFAISVNTRAI